MRLSAAIGCGLSGEAGLSSISAAVSLLLLSYRPVDCYGELRFGGIVADDRQLTAVVAGSETCGLHLEFELCSPAVLQFVLADGGTQLLAVVQHAANLQRVGTYVSQADCTFANLD